MSEFVEYGNLRNDICTTLNEKNNEKIIFFQKIVEVVHVPVFILDTLPLEKLLEQSR